MKKITALLMASIFVLGANALAFAAVPTVGALPVGEVVLYDDYDEEDEVETIDDDEGEVGTEDDDDNDVDIDGDDEDDEA